MKARTLMMAMALLAGEKAMAENPITRAGTLQQMTNVVVNIITGAGFSTNSGGPASGQTNIAVAGVTNAGSLAYSNSLKVGDITGATAMTNSAAFTNDNRAWTVGTLNGYTLANLASSNSLKVGDVTGATAMTNSAAFTNDNRAWTVGTLNGYTLANLASSNSLKVGDVTGATAMTNAAAFTNDNRAWTVGTLNGYTLANLASSNSLKVGDVTGATAMTNSALFTNDTRAVILNNANSGLNVGTVTNAALTASAAVITDANKKQIGLANGGNNTVLHGTTPPAYSAVVEADQTLADNTTADASTSAHGYEAKGSNRPWEFRRSDNTWARAPLAILCGNSANQTTAANSSNFYAISGNKSTNLATAYSAMFTADVMPRAATFTNFYGRISAASGSGKSTTFVVKSNGVDTAITFQITGTSATTGNDTTHSFTCVAGDDVGIAVGTQSGGTAVSASWGIEGR